jgi:hypothetical protein
MFVTSFGNDRRPIACFHRHKSQVDENAKGGSSRGRRKRGCSRGRRKRECMGIFLGIVGVLKNTRVLSSK